MTTKLFFMASRQAAANITDIFDFVWPTAAAMWNLRWQVDGFLRIHPSVSEDILVGRFIQGSGINGANLRSACIDTSWQQQQERFAKFLLIEVCALYEGWLEGVKGELGLASFNVKGFQFPSTNGRGLQAALADATASVSAEMASCISPALAKNKKYANQKIENLLKCYSYFKECRNSLIHRGSLVDQKVFDAYVSYNALTRNDLGLKEKPQCTTANSIGDKVAPQLRGIVGLTDVVLRIITTLDAELCKCKEAESVLATMWNEKHGGAVTLPSDQSAKIRRVKRLINQLDLPEPSQPVQLIQMLRRLNLTYY
ncbi:MAG: hypothetical protein VKM17_02470 [Cyanobacteriota bacterium]|nr:hypothetical protein [Cyanobacteriota bacterium]